MPRTGDHAVDERPGAERRTHVGAEVVHRVVAHAIMEHGHEPASHLECPPFAHGNLPDAGNGREGVRG